MVYCLVGGECNDYIVGTEAIGVTFGRVHSSVFVVPCCTSCIWAV